jgi:hypothetical protein
MAKVVFRSSVPHAGHALYETSDTPDRDLLESGFTEPVWVQFLPPADSAPPGVDLQKNPATLRLNERRAQGNGLRVPFSFANPAQARMAVEAAPGRGFEIHVLLIQPEKDAFDADSSRYVGVGRCVLAPPGEPTPLMLEFDPAEAEGVRALIDRLSANHPSIERPPMSHLWKTTLDAFVLTVQASSPRPASSGLGEPSATRFWYRAFGDPSSPQIRDAEIRLYQRAGPFRVDAIGSKAKP